MDGLVIQMDYLCNIFDWDSLFEKLAKLSPPNLYKFNHCNSTIKLETLKLFFDNWKGRHPMFLQTNISEKRYLDLIEQYKIEKIIKKYDSRENFDTFEWIEKRSY